MSLPSPRQILTINDDDGRMFCKDTPHEAVRCGDHWEVSWLPGRELDRNQAISAITLAWEVAVNGVHGGNWPFIATWASELGMKGSDAVAMCTGEGGRADG